MFEFLENRCLHCWFQEELGEVLGSYFVQFGSICLLLTMQYWVHSQDTLGKLICMNTLLVLVTRFPVFRGSLSYF